MPENERHMGPAHGLTFPEYLRIIRKRSRLRQAETGQHIQLSESAYSRIESGERQLTESQKETLFTILSGKFRDANEVQAGLENSFKRNVLANELGSIIARYLETNFSVDELENKLREYTSSNTRENLADVFNKPIPDTDSRL